jgi:hypothetical protein
MILLMKTCHFFTTILLKKAKAVPLHAREALGGERRYSFY